MIIEFHVCDMSLLAEVHVIWMPGQKAPVQTPVSSTGMLANICVQKQSQPSSCLCWSVHLLLNSYVHSSLTFPGFPSK